MNKSVSLLIAFAVGQITQLILHGMVVSLNMWDSRRVIFCGAFGFVILFAAISGVVIANKQDERLDREFKRSYLDYAEVPGEGADVHEERD